MMAEISHGGLWVRWSSLKPRDKRDFAISMLLFLAAGFAQGYTMGMFKGTTDPLRPTDILLILSPTLPVIAAMILYLRFVLRQDELFRMFHIITSLWFLGGLLLIGFPGMLINDAFQAEVVTLRHTLLGGAFCSMIGGFWASRRYL